MVLRDGRVAEHGARVALQADPTSSFARLLRTGAETVDLAEAEAPASGAHGPARHAPVEVPA